VGHSWTTTDRHDHVHSFLRQLKGTVGHVYPNVVADSGYESEENYLYLGKNEQTAYIKPSNYEQRKTRKYRTDIGRRENMLYDEESDSYVCSNQKRLLKTST
jgi:hypothetical protein